MAKNTLFNHIWNQHKVCTLPNGQDQIFIGMHLIHEVTTPQAFAKLKEAGLKVAYPHRTFATVDHIIPTEKQTQRPFQDPQAEKMCQALEQNVKENQLTFFNSASQKQGIVHVIGPELGLTQPGMTIACGDSHTSTHGAFGSIGIGIGTTEVGLLLATQTLALTPLNVRRIEFKGTLQNGVHAKDVVLKIIQQLGVNGGIGYAYEFGGDVFDAMSMDERLTVCNMSIEGGARIGYVNPDQTTFDYIKGREYAPKGEAFDTAVKEWQRIASGPDAIYDDTVQFNGDTLAPMVTWGINPAQSVEITDPLPHLDHIPENERKVAEEAYAYMDLKPGQAIEGAPIDVVFIGSCTNSRLSDIRIAAQVLKNQKVASNVRALVVPGSQAVKAAAEAEDLHRIITESGAEWREPGCSMCLAMNSDRLNGNERCASTSNRNFIGRQGSPSGQTLLMSPAMAAAAAITGQVTDVRSL
ncbi:MAG: 3-isopropylmalate dehydratase large subunit [Actinobacteria bacterium]|nr:3-isopropylmalate dehydratase large subunit [Actinomycetota bacterium]